jgi:hypothetical protein
VAPGIEGIGEAEGRALAQVLRRPIEQPTEVVELLDVGGDETLATRRHDYREDRLAQRPRLGELGEAPFALQPVRRQDQDDGVGAVDLLVERPLPVGAGLDAGMLVDVEERLVEAVRLEPRHDVGGDFIVEAGMGDENPRHEAKLGPSSTEDRVTEGEANATPSPPLAGGAIAFGSSHPPLPGGERSSRLRTPALSRGS